MYNQSHVNLSKSQATNLQRRAVEVLLHGIEFTMKKVTHPSLGPLLKSKLAFLGLGASYKKFRQFSF